MALLVGAVTALAASIARGHEIEDRREGAGDPTSQVVIKVEGDRRIIEANGLPNHKPGQFPNRGNPNSISVQRYRFEMRLKPKANDEPRPVERCIFGVAVNGVVFDPGTAEVWRPGQPIVSRPGPETRRGPGDNPRTTWNYDGMGTMRLGLDSHHAHVQPNGAYHYHGLPTGLVAALRKEHSDHRMLLIGYAADGFPIYAEYGHEKADDASSPVKKLRSSYRLRKGDRPTGNAGPGGRYDGTFTQDYEFVKGSGDLDECNGRTGVTPEYPGGTYYYVVTETFPYIPRLFRGTPDASFEKQLGPRPGGRGGPIGRPPRSRRASPPR
jgi:hypothetical protein